MLIPPDEHNLLLADAVIQPGAGANLSHSVMPVT